MTNSGIPDCAAQTVARSIRANQFPLFKIIFPCRLQILCRFIGEHIGWKSNNIAFVIRDVQTSTTLIARAGMEHCLTIEKSPKAE
jgi:hypothetical protein